MCGKVLRNSNVKSILWCVLLGSSSNNLFFSYLKVIASKTLISSLHINTLFSLLLYLRVIKHQSHKIIISTLVMLIFVFYYDST